MSSSEKIITIEEAARRFFAEQEKRRLRYIQNRDARREYAHDHYHNKVKPRRVAIKATKIMEAPKPFLPPKSKKEVIEEHKVKTIKSVRKRPKEKKLESVAEAFAT
jgi:hypothetical protein